MHYDDSFFSHYDNHYDGHYDNATTLLEQQICAGFPTNSGYTAAYTGPLLPYLGAPLICFDKASDPGKLKPLFTGIGTRNLLSKKANLPGVYNNLLEIKDGLMAELGLLQLSKSCHSKS